MKRSFLLFLFIFLIGLSPIHAQVSDQVLSMCKKEDQELLKDKLDPRLRKAIEEWTAWETYNNETVQIPEAWIIHLFDYDGRDKIETKEKQVWVGLGWRCYDAEIIIAFGLFADNPNVSVEITRLGGAEVHVLYRGIEVVKFKVYKKGSAKGYYATTIPSLENRKTTKHTIWIFRLPSKLLKKL